MKRLTFEQAKQTPNIAFLATPEQLKQWNIPKQFSINLEIPNIVLLDKYGTVIRFTEYVNEQSKKWFKEGFTPYMIEIIEEDSLVFNSQQEVWQWLAEGNKVESTLAVVGFNVGTLWNFTDNNRYSNEYDFNNYRCWTKYKEPEYIIINGFQVPKPIKQLSEFKLANLLIEEGIHSNSENAYIHAQAILGCIDQ